jgi:hypothetical protein
MQPPVTAEEWDAQHRAEHTAQMRHSMREAHRLLRQLREARREIHYLRAQLAAHAWRPEALH